MTGSNQLCELSPGSHLRFVEQPVNASCRQSAVMPGQPDDEILGAASDRNRNGITVQSELRRFGNPDDRHALPLFALRDSKCAKGGEAKLAMHFRKQWEYILSRPTDTRSEAAA